MQIIRKIQVAHFAHIILEFPLGLLWALSDSLLGLGLDVRWIKTSNFADLMRK
jgi:hypothetical protein